MELEVTKREQVIDAAELVVLLKNWTKALEEKTDLSFEFGDEVMQIPVATLAEGRCKIEFKQKPGKMDFELKLKWADSKLD